MNYKIILIAWILFCGNLYSQEFNVNGTVKDETGMPLPGVSVLIKGTTTGTATDFDGNFELEKVSNNAVLVFSSLGSVTTEFVVTKSGTISIVLKEDTQSLEEVVVIGYGSQKKREVTGAVSVVDSKTLDKIKPVRVEQALQGTVSGVNVTSTSGSPGAELNIRIRGIGTNGNNRPTTIIDGYVGELGLLNPNDIESITVLKDAQAAIYGTIGANGIILVTTKKGRKNQKPQFNYNSYVGFQSTTRELPTLNATEYALLLNESYANGGQALPYPNVNGLGEGTNWQSEIFGTNVPIVNHDINIQGGSENISYAVSGSHLEQEGIVGGDKSGFLRNTARISLNGNITDKVKFKTNVIYTYFNRKTLNENGLGSVLFNALNTPSTLTPYDANGDFTLVPNTTGLGIEIINPLAQIANTYNNYDFKKLNGNFGIDYEVTKNFIITSQIGFNTSYSEAKTFSPEISYGGKVFDNPRSSVSQNAINDNNYSFDLFGTYTKKINEVHNLQGTLGTTVYKEWGNGLFATGYDVPNNSWAFADISLANGTFDGLTNASYTYDQRRLSYFGRVQYDYSGKYLVSAMLRRDTSTKFGPSFRVGYFPSLTAGWIISDEKFFGEKKNFNFLKFRASYGTLGNDQIGNFGYLGVLGGEATYVFDGALVNGTATGVIPNPDLKWEQAEKIDIGLDMKFFDNKLEVITDYFIDTRQDLLILGIPVSDISGILAPGAGSPTKNAGTVRNSGLELAFNYNDKIGEDLSFSLGYNVTFLKNEVLKVDNGTGIVEGGAFGVGQLPPARMEVGQPIGYFYGYQTDGIFQNQAEVDAHPSQIALGAEASPGDIRFKDVNGDGVIDANDRTNIGNPIPAATMGFNLQLNYKNFDFSAYVFASVGNDMVRNYERVLSDVNRLDYVLDRWTGEGTSNSVPRVTTGASTNNVFSDYFVEDASFLRLQNIQLGYNIPSTLLEKVKISKLRLYGSVTNLFTLTKYKGYDPSASNGAPIGGGIDNGFYPLPKTFILGLNLNF
uniref:SusC/RagA family TonB-linked outer membrane protein n=2 Tax=Flavobacterium sp. TaxID=239 RepID=UPI00404A02BE